MEFLKAINTMHIRGIKIDSRQYLFALSVTLGERPEVAYAMLYDKDNFTKHLGTESEDEYLSEKRKDASTFRESQEIRQLEDYVQSEYHSEVQSRAMNLENFKFTGGEIAQILQNLLHNRISDLDTASTKDVIQLVKMLTDQFGLDGGSDFEKHFIHIFPPFNALCGKCGHEFDAYKGVDCVCPHCGSVYKWVESDNRFYPSINSL